MEDLINIINNLITDNNTNQITPFKMRQVLVSIVQAMATNGQISLTAKYPLDIDGFTGVIQLKSVPFGGFERIGKGWKPGTDPADPTTRNYIDEDQAGDFFWGSSVDGTWYLVTRWNGEGDKNDPANHIGTVTSSLYFPGEPGYEHD